MRNYSTIRVLQIAFGLLVPFVTAQAEIKLPHLFTDHAVLQRERPIHLWGQASGGAVLKVTFHKQSLSAVADDDGDWELWLAPESAGGPYELKLTGDGSSLILSDLLVGDVWVASGQSNMEMPLNGFKDAPVNNSASIIAAANSRLIRLLHIPKRASKQVQGDADTEWKRCSPDTAATFSAVAYLFGQELATHENVPIGLIEATWGGTPAEAWTSADAMQSNPSLQGPELHNDPVWHPSQLYNAMIAPLTPYSIRGFLWYQGESNSGPMERAKDYETLFPALIADWRMHFAQGSLPFLFVQISSYNSKLENWGVIRDAQRRTLDVANTAMAVSLDVGMRNNVHPPDKQTVAARLALAARAMVYGEALEFQAPAFRQATVEGQALRVWFDHARGLTARSEEITGFELAGEDHRFQPAKAVLDGETVVVSSAGLATPVYVRFAWPNTAVTNLYSSAGLPLSTFTSEDHSTQP